MSKKKLTPEQVLYCRENYKAGDGQFGIKALAQKFGVSVDALKGVIHGKSYAEVGGTIHPKMERVPQDVQEAIAAAYVPNSSDNNLNALAARFGFSVGTIIKYVHKHKPVAHRGRVTDEIKAAIIAEYEPYSETAGRDALAQKYGISTATVSNIVREVRPPSKRRGRRAAVVPDDVKEEIIIAHDEEKLSVRALSERFGLSRDVIKGVLEEAGIEIRTRQRVDDEIKQEIIQEFKAGRSMRELAAIYKINRATIAGWVENFKPTKPPKKELDQTTREQIYRYHSQGYGASIIAKTVGLSHQIVRKVIDGEL